MPRKPKLPPITRTPDQMRLGLKKKVRIFYDLQRIRMQVAGRTLKRGEGMEIQLHEVDVAILEGRAKELLKAEKNALADVKAHLGTMPFYIDTLSDKKRYKGIGPTMAGVILSEFDIYREDTPSKMWAFAGLKTVPCERCAMCNRVVTNGKHHPVAGAAKCTETATYTSSARQYGKKGEKFPYNQFLKTKLVGVLGAVLLKVNSPWRSFYDNYKHRKQSAGWGFSDGHRHNAAIRYMVKMLLLDIWGEWRRHENLPVRPSYAEEYLGKTHQNGHHACDTQDDHASQMRNGTQPRSASQRERDAHQACASHKPCDAQDDGASQKAGDLQRNYASHLPRDTHRDRALYDAEIENELDLLESVEQ